MRISGIGTCLCVFSMVAARILPPSSPPPHIVAPVPPPLIKQGAAEPNPFKALTRHLGLSVHKPAS